MVNYSGIARSPLVMSAPNPRFQGEMLVFNNQRLMHGRTAFDPANSKRHIRSCHVDLDEFYSRLRILYAKRQDPRRWMTFR